MSKKWTPENSAREEARMVAVQRIHQEHLGEKSIREVADFVQEKNGVKWYSLQIYSNHTHFILWQDRVVSGGWGLGRYVLYALADLSTNEEREAWLQSRDRASWQTTDFLSV
jgi:hypothetical protein